MLLVSYLAIIFYPRQGVDILGELDIDPSRVERLMRGCQQTVEEFSQTLTPKKQPKTLSNKKEETSNIVTPSDSGAIKQLFFIFERILQ